MLQYNGVTGKGSRVPPHGAASSSLGYGLPGSLSQGAYMSGGQQPPPSRAGVPFWKVPHPSPNPSPHPVSLTLPLSLTPPLSVSLSLSVSLRLTKVRPDGIETDVALVVDRLVAKVEGQEVRGMVGGGGVFGGEGGEGGVGGLRAAASRT